MLKAINSRINEGNVARLSLVANEWLCLVLSKAHCKLLLMVNNLCLMSGLIVVDVKQTIKCIAVLDFALSSSTFLLGVSTHKLNLRAITWDKNM